MILIIYFSIINLFAMILYGVDKKKAEKHQYRISEAALLSVAFLGGPYGAFLGMCVFHHKTRKPRFTITIPVLMVVYAAVIAFLWMKLYGGK